MHSDFPPEARAGVQGLASSQIREVANSAMGRADVLPFWFGESDRPTAGFIRQAAQDSIAAGETFYAQNLGRPYLRAAIAQYLSALHGRAVSDGRISVLNSGVSAIAVICQLLLSPGDRVVAVTPLWPNITEAPRILGARVDRVPLTVAGGQWSLDLDRLLAALTPDTRMLIINSPNNPTGWVMTDPQVQAILHHCRKAGIWVIADDVYERLVFDSSRRVAPGFLPHADPDERVISINSFSKAWSMTGWRIGWVVAPQRLADDMAKLIEYNFSCVFEPVQRAAVAALTRGEDEVAAFRASLIDTRAALTAGLARLPGVEMPGAGGAMYAFFRLPGGANSVETAKRLVAGVGLGLAPGSAFGPEGEGWLRWCHAVSDDRRLSEGVDRLARFIGQDSP